MAAIRPNQKLCIDQAQSIFGNKFDYFFCGKIRPTLLFYEERN